MSGRTLGGRALDGLARRPRLAAFTLGLVSATGFAPLSLWPVALLAFALFMGLVLRAASLRAALWIGWLFGWGQFSLGLNWIQKSWTYQEAMPHWLGYAAPVLLSVYLAVFPLAAAGLAWRFGRRDPRVFVLAFAAAWVVVELLRARLFTGFPWNPLGAWFVPLPELARAAGWIGTYGLSGIAVLAAGALLLLALADRRGGLVLAGAIAALTLTGIRATPPIPADAPRVAIVQPDIDQNLVQDFSRLPEVEATYQRLSRQRTSTAPRLLLWPEGAIRSLVEDGYPRWSYDSDPPEAVRARLTSTLLPGDALLTGADTLVFEGQQMTAARNAIFVLTADGRITDRYDKAHLVPWGEYLPGRPVTEWIGLTRLVPGALDFLPGPGPRNLTPPGFAPVGLQVCYEIVFSGQIVDRSERPRFIFNPSNDAWFGGWGPPQHFAQARLRAIEEGLPVVRATPTGISGIIDADGRVTAALPLAAQGVIEAAVPPARPATLFARVGLPLSWGFAALLALIAVALAFRRR